MRGGNGSQSRPVVRPMEEQPKRVIPAFTTEAEEAEYWKLGC
jgi:hypothetical protein